MSLVGIVGAGIGGLTTALACKQAGFDVRVFDQAPALQEVGAGLQLGPNAVHVLVALGLDAALAEVAVKPEAIHMRAAQSGHLLAYLPLGDAGDQRYGAPYYHVHRADLQSILLDKLKDVGVTPELDAQCVHVTEEAPHVRVGFRDGREARFDAVIGADGIHSFVREHLFGPEHPRFTGYVAFRGVVPAHALDESVIEPVVTAWLGARQHFISYFVRRRELVNYVAVVENDTWREEAWDIPADKTELSDPFHDWHVNVRRVIEATVSCHKWALLDRDPLEQWSSGRVTLLGDACHPMLPFLAQGAAMAIEDAYALAHMLELHSRDLSHALTQYATHRRPRTSRVQLESRRQGKLYHLTNPLQVASRNFVIGFGSRMLPGLARRRYDWLFGFDAVRLVT